MQWSLSFQPFYGAPGPGDLAKLDEATSLSSIFYLVPGIESMTLSQGFSTWIMFDIWVQIILCGAGCPINYRNLNNLCGLYPLNVCRVLCSAPQQLWKSSMSADTAKCPLGTKSLLDENHWSTITPESRGKKVGNTKWWGGPGFPMHSPE